MYPVVVIRQPGCTPIHLQVREPIEVGRECTGVVLSDPRVSRRHLVLAPTKAGGPAEVAVLDLGSMNGTILAGVRLTSEAILRPGNEVRIGDSTITLILDRADASAPTPYPDLPDESAATTVLPTRPRQPDTPTGNPWRRPPAQPRPTRPDAAGEEGWGDDSWG